MIVYLRLNKVIKFRALSKKETITSNNQRELEKKIGVEVTRSYGGSADWGCTATIAAYAEVVPLKS
ncbi:unnamed protein product [Nezara viridula]|uniref:Uncharacterized protein n=1 Tax=Nezara viridula TaxID=85310 RepID=A0A9P0HQ41_NEZVI|nr:unnamed protein product [Nezara viridula]